MKCILNSYNPSNNFSRKCVSGEVEVPLPPRVVCLELFAEGEMAAGSMLVEQGVELRSMIMMNRMT